MEANSCQVDQYIPYGFGLLVSANILLVLLISIECYVNYFKKSVSVGRQMEEGRSGRQQESVRQPLGYDHLKDVMQKLNQDTEEKINQTEFNLKSEFKILENQIVLDTEKRRKKMEHDLQRAEEELGDWAAVLSTSTLLKTDLKKYTDELNNQLGEIERQMEEIKEKIQQVEKEISESEKNKTISKTKHLLEERKQKLDVQWKAEKRKEEVEALQLIFKKMMMKTESQMTKMMEMNNRTEAYKQLIRMQQQEFEMTEDR